MTKKYWEVQLAISAVLYKPLIREVEVVRETEGAVWLKELQGHFPPFRKKRGDYYQYYTDKQDAVEAYVRQMTHRKDELHTEIV